VFANLDGATVHGFLAALALRHEDSLALESFGEGGEAVRASAGRTVCEDGVDDEEDHNAPHEGAVGGVVEVEEAVHMRVGPYGDHALFGNEVSELLEARSALEDALVPVIALVQINIWPVVRCACDMWTTRMIQLCSG